MLPNIVLTAQDGGLIISLLKDNKTVDLAIASNPIDMEFTKRRIKDMGLDLTLVKEWKVCYNMDDSLKKLEEKYMDDDKTLKTDINIFTNWAFQQGNQGAWVDQHYKFKPLLGETGTMVAHSTTQFVSGTRKKDGIFTDLQESNTTYLDMSTETRFKPAIGVRSGYYVTGNGNYPGTTKIKTIDGKEIDVDITKYPALPCVLSEEIFDLFEEIHNLNKNQFGSFTEQVTEKAKGKCVIAVPKADKAPWHQKSLVLDPKKTKLPTSKQCLVFDLSYYDENERNSLCSQMDLSITRCWLAMMGWLDRRSGGWLCRSIPMWDTDEIYNDAKFFKKYPTLQKYKALILELAGKIKPNEK